MGHLVRQHDFDFVVGVVREHRVGHENSPGRADAGQRRVRFLRFASQAPFVCAEDTGARSVGESDQPAAQPIAVERLDRIEERQQQNRRDVGQADNQQREQAARPHPPAIRGSPHLRVDQFGADFAQKHADAECLRLIEQPRLRLLRGQLVATFEEKPAVEGERQGAQLVDGRQQDDVAEDGDRRLPRGRREPDGESLGRLAHRQADAARQQNREQQRAPDQPEDARLSLQPMISPGSVLVHAAGMSSTLEIVFFVPSCLRGPSTLLVIPMQLTAVSSSTMHFRG